jgi:hypothetical protein
MKAGKAVDAYRVAETMMSPFVKTHNGPSMRAQMPYGVPNLKATKASAVKITNMAWSILSIG